MRELERSETTYDLPHALCQAYTDDPATDEQLHKLRSGTNGKAIQCRKVVFGLFQDSPTGGGETLELFVQARVRL